MTMFRSTIFEYGRLRSLLRSERRQLFMPILQVVSISYLQRVLMVKFTFRPTWRNVCPTFLVKIRRPPPLFPIEYHFAQIVLERRYRNVIRIILIRCNICSIHLRRIISRNSKCTSRFQSRPFRRFHQRMVRHRFSPFVAFPRARRRSFFILLGISVRIVTCGIARLFIRSNGTFAKHSSQYVCHLLLRRRYVSRGKVARMLVVFLHSGVIQLPIDAIHRRFQ